MTRLERFVLSMMFAFLVAGITLVVASAQSETPATPTVTSGQQGNEPSKCGECHPDYQNSWYTGAHGKASSDPVFTDTWTKQGKPGACLVCHVTGYDPATATWKQDGVSCEACHNPVPADHPNQPMPVYRTADLCGRCHSDTRFGWAEWKVSAHYQRDMTCTVCHDPHTASLKQIEGKYGQAMDASGLCLNCHKEYSMQFPYSIHSQKGIKCVDCHLRHLGDTSSTDQIHTLPDHSFKASLATCTACHADQMHAAANVTITPSATETATPVQEESGMGSMQEKPSPVSPAGYAGLAGLIGLAGGMVLSPWMERWYRNITVNKEHKND